MTDWQLRFYHRLPSPCKSLLASVRGHQLRSWRYGPETERLVAEALERDFWTQEQWRNWQQKRLQFVLHRAATRVPYYRSYWEERRRKGDKASWEDLANWPILEKDTVRAQERAFVADDCDIRRMYHEHSSGTTGKPLNFWSSRDTIRQWYALFEARWRCWYGISRKDNWALVGGQLVVPFAQRKPPFWVWNFPMKQLYMSSYHLAPELIPFYIKALQEYRIEYMWGYSSSLHSLAQEVLRLGLKIKLRAVIANAEPLLSHQRQSIEEAFQCPARETYGMTEMAAAASECEHRNLHLWPEVGWLEILDGERSVEAGETGDLITTGLLNADMPLIRYRVGDRGVFSSATSCSCRRSLPILAAVVGRVDDVLYTPDGRQIGRLDPVFKAGLGIREAQIIQKALDAVTIRFVPAPDYQPSSGQNMINRLRARMGPVRIDLEPVDSIPRSANGKFRAVICHVPKEQRLGKSINLETPQI